MRISDEALAELQTIHRESYGENVSLDEAREMGQRLLTLYRLVMQPFPGESCGHNQEPAAQIAPEVP